jgi:hypothetical protein
MRMAIATLLNSTSTYMENAGKLLHSSVIFLFQFGAVEKLKGTRRCFFGV